MKILQVFEEDVEGRRFPIVDCRDLDTVNTIR